MRILLHQGGIKPLDFLKLTSPQYKYIFMQPNATWVMSELPPLLTSERWEFPLLTSRIVPEYIFIHYIGPWEDSLHNCITHNPNPTDNTPSTSSSTSSDEESEEKETKITKAI